MLVTLRSLRKFYDIWNLLSIKTTEWQEYPGNEHFYRCITIHTYVSITVHSGIHNCTYTPALIFTLLQVVSTPTAALLCFQSLRMDPFIRCFHEPAEGCCLYPESCSSDLHLKPSFPNMRHLGNIWIQQLIAQYTSSWKCLSLWDTRDS